MIDKNRFPLESLPYGGFPSARLIAERTARDTIPARFSTEMAPTDGYADRVETVKEHRMDVLTHPTVGPTNTTPKGEPVPIGTGVVNRSVNGGNVEVLVDGVLRARLGQWPSEENVTTLPVKLPVQPEVPGVYRPNLEDRKVGKVRVELVDDGFPLALREVAKVMTWAQSAKGYKDHDWQNLPNAEQALAAATSRHRSDYIIQRKVDGLFPEMCVDHESEISHKAHEAFGVLAQLELLLRGEFK